MVGFWLRNRYIKKQYRIGVLLGKMYKYRRKDDNYARGEIREGGTSARV